MLDRDVVIAVEQIAERPDALKALLEGVALALGADTQSKLHAQDVQKLVDNFDAVEAYMQ